MDELLGTDFPPAPPVTGRWADVVVTAMAVVIAIVAAILVR
jgi:hypothetical protein